MPNHSDFKLDQNQLNTVSNFQKSLEQILLADAHICVCPFTQEYICLVVEINFDYRLSEVISLLKIANDKNGLSNTIDRIKSALNTFEQEINSQFDFEEVSIYFRNTTITIKSIHQHSIMEEIEEILHEIFDHYENYASLMGSVPNEIHIPVFEDRRSKENLDKYGSSPVPNLRTPYSQYWGLYFDSVVKPLIYDLRRTNITPGNLDLCF